MHWARLKQKKRGKGKTLEYPKLNTIKIMKVVNQVYETNDYSMFKTLKGNRNVNKLHIRRLRESFKALYLLSPIIVNQDFEIIDGQHRFEAAKEINKNVYFIICNDYGLREVQILNTNMKNWQKKDYLNAFCDAGYSDYLQLRNFMRRFSEFPIDACISLLTNASRAERRSSCPELKSETNKGGDYALRYFEEGKFKVIDYDNGVDLAEKIRMVKPFYQGYNRKIFISAMITLFKNENYNHSQFISKLKINSTMMQDCSNVTQYKLLIEDIYNYRSREKVNLRY
jgi:hypothetical protein